MVLARRTTGPLASLSGNCRDGRSRPALANELGCDRRDRETAGWQAAPAISLFVKLIKIALPIKSSGTRTTVLWVTKAADATLEVK